MGVKHIVTDEKWEAKKGSALNLLIVIFVLPMLLIIGAIINVLAS